MEKNKEVRDLNGTSLFDLQSKHKQICFLHITMVGATHNVEEELALDEDTESQDMQLGQGSAPSQGDLIVEYPQSIPERPQLKSSVMLVSSFRHSKYHANKVNELIESSFTQDAMHEDMAKVAEMLSMEKVKKNRSTDKRSGGAGQAQALYQLLEDLDSSGTTPEFVVGLDEMEEVQRALTNSVLGHWR